MTRKSQWCKDKWGGHSRLREEQKEITSSSNHDASLSRAEEQGEERTKLCKQSIALQRGKINLKVIISVWEDIGGLSRKGTDSNLYFKKKHCMENRLYWTRKKTRKPLGKYLVISSALDWSRGSGESEKRTDLGHTLDPE